MAFLTGRLDAIMREPAGELVFGRLHEVRDLAIAARQHSGRASLETKRTGILRRRLERNNYSPAANLASHSIVGDWNHPEALLKLASQVDVVMGMVAARRLEDLKKVGLFLVGFGIAAPLLHGGLGVLAGKFVGLSLGGMTLLGALAASASYIAAPAAMRLSLPEANPTLYLTSALAITFPFNIAVGIPIYFGIARWLHTTP